MGYIEDLLGRNERIVFATRQHWVRILPSILGGAALAAVILGLTFALPQILFPWSLLLLLALVYPLWHLTATALFWYNRRYIITNRRVIEMRGVFSKVMSDSSLEKVTDVVLEQSAMGRLLGFGDVEILTASDVGVSLLKTIADPIGFKVWMLDQKESLLGIGDLASEGEGAVEAADVPQLIQDLDELRQKGILTAEEFQAEKQELLDEL